MKQVYEDNSSRWEQQPDGSFTHLPKQKQPPTSLGAVKESIAANAAAVSQNTTDIATNALAITGLETALPVGYSASSTFSCPSNTGNNRVTGLISATEDLNTAGWTYFDTDTIEVKVSGVYLVSCYLGFGSGTGTVRGLVVGSEDLSTGLGNIISATGDPSGGNTSGFGYANGATSVRYLQEGWKIRMFARQDSGSNNTLTWRFTALMLKPDVQAQTRIAAQADFEGGVPVEYDLAAISRESYTGPYTGTQILPMETAYGKTQYCNVGAGTITIWEDGVYKVDAHYTNAGTTSPAAGTRLVLSVPDVCRAIHVTPTTQNSDIALIATHTKWLAAGTVLNVTAHFGASTTIGRASLVAQRLDTARNVATTPHACVLQGTGTQAVPHATPRTPVTFWQAEHDPSGMYQGGSLVNIPTDGLYQVEGHIAFEANATGNRAIGVIINGTEGWESNVGASAWRGNLGVSKVFSLSAGDTVGLWAYQASGANLNITGASNPHYSWLSVVRIGSDPLEVGAGAEVLLQPAESGGATTTFNPTVNGASFTTFGSTGFGFAVNGTPPGITVPVAGTYMLYLQFRGGGTGGDNGWWSILAHRNGTAEVNTNHWFRAIGDNNMSTTMNVPLRLAAGDTVGLRLFRTPQATGDLNIYDGIVRVVYMGP